MARRRARKINWSAAKATLVAIKRVGVGPGVKMLDHRSSMKEAIIFKKRKWKLGNPKVCKRRGNEGSGTGIRGGNGKWLPEWTTLRYEGRHRLGKRVDNEFRCFFFFFGLK